MKEVGKLEYVWFPNPHIQFSFSSQDPNINNLAANTVDIQPTSLTLSDIGVSVDICIVTSVVLVGVMGISVSGRLKEAIAQGKDQDLAYVLFHVVNFHNFMRKTSINS